MCSSQAISLAGHVVGIVSHQALPTTQIMHNNIQRMPVKHLVRLWTAYMYSVRAQSSALWATGTVMSIVLSVDGWPDPPAAGHNTQHPLLSKVWWCSAAHPSGDVPAYVHPGMHAPLTAAQHHTLCDAHLLLTPPSEPASMPEATAAACAM